MGFYLWRKISLLSIHYSFKCNNKLNGIKRNILFTLAISSILGVKHNCLNAKKEMKSAYFAGLFDKTIEFSLKNKV